MNGGAHGLGLASLKLFAAEGADVAFFQPAKEDKIEAAKAEIDAAGPGPRCVAEVFDMAIGETEAYQGVAWRKARQGIGGPAIYFVHTAKRLGQPAGVGRPGRPASTMDPERGGPSRSRRFDALYSKRRIAARS